MATKAVSFDKNKVKMLDLSSDKTAASTKKVVMEVNRIFMNQFKSANIPVLKILEKNMNIETFFMHHIDLEAIMGEHVDLVDRMMMSAICQYITNDILDSIESAKMKYVGIWDNYTIYSIASAAITFMKNDQDSSKYLTSLQYAQISIPDLAALPKNSYMQFDMYTPNTFVEQIILIRKVVVETMSNIIQNKIPMAFLGSSDRPVPYRFYEAFRSMMTDDIREYMDRGGITLDNLPDTKATEKKISKFVEYFETPFLSMMTMYLGQSGVSSNMINLVLGASKIHIQYSDAVDNDINLRDVQITYIMYHGALKDPKSIHVTCMFTIGDIIDMCMLEESSISKTRKENFGKTLRTFLLNMLVYLFNVYTKTVNGDQPDYTKDIATSGYIQPVEDGTIPTETNKEVENVLDGLE